MSRNLLFSAAALVCALCTMSQTYADPPDAAINPHTWVMIGKWDDNPLLVRRSSIKRYGHIYDVIYSEDGYKDSDNIWDPAI